MKQDYSEFESFGLGFMFQSEVEEWFNKILLKQNEEHACQIAVWLAARCAARVFPIIWMNNDNHLTFPALRALILSRVAGQFLTPEIANAAKRASLEITRFHNENFTLRPFVYNASMCVIYSSISASVSSFINSSRAAAAADSAVDDIAASTGVHTMNTASIAALSGATDLKWLENNNYISGAILPLWQGKSNFMVEIILTGVKHELERDPDNVWSFFLDDYDRQLAGETPDWHVLKALAHPDAIEVWQSHDPKQLADYIHQIQGARDARSVSPSKAPDSLTDTLEAIARKTPIGARFRYNPENHLIEEVSLTTSTDEEIDHATYEIGEAQNALRGLNENVRGLFQPVFAGLNQALEPENRKATKLFSAAMACQRQIIKICEVNVLGNPKDDPCIHRALNALEIAIACLHFPEEERPIIDTIIDVAALANALDISNPASDFNMLVDLSTAASEPDLAANIEAYREIIQDPNADEQAKQIAWHYLLGIVSRIGLVALGIPSDALLFTIPEIALFIKSEARRLLWDVLRDLVKESLKDWFRGE